MYRLLLADRKALILALSSFLECNSTCLKAVFTKQEYSGIYVLLVFCTFTKLLILRMKLFDTFNSTA